MELTSEFSPASLHLVWKNQKLNYNMQQSTRANIQSLCRICKILACRPISLSLTLWYSMETTWVSSASYFISLWLSSCLKPCKAALSYDYTRLITIQSLDCTVKGRHDLSSPSCIASCSRLDRPIALGLYRKWLHQHFYIVRWCSSQWHSSLTHITNFHIELYCLLYSNHTYCIKPTTAVSIHVACHYLMDHY